MNERFLLLYNTESSPKQMFKQYDFLHIMTTYGCFALVQMGYDTIYPVILSAPRSLGGLALNSEAIGYIVGISSIYLLAMGFISFTCLSVVLIIPQVSRLTSYRNQFAMYCILFHLFILLTPLMLRSRELSDIVGLDIPTDE